jgi:hypothetical protein
MLHEPLHQAPGALYTTLVKPIFYIMVNSLSSRRLLSCSVLYNKFHVFGTAGAFNDRVPRHCDTIALALLALQCPTLEHHQLHAHGTHFY